MVSLPSLLTSMESNLISQAQYLECLSLWCVKHQCCRRKTDTPLGWNVSFFFFLLSPKLGLHQSSSAYSLVLVQTLLTQPRVESVRCERGSLGVKQIDVFKLPKYAPTPRPPWTISHVCSETRCSVRCQSVVPGSFLWRENTSPTGSAHRLSAGFHRTITAAYGEERRRDDASPKLLVGFEVRGAATGHLLTGSSSGM